MYRHVPVTRAGPFWRQPARYSAVRDARMACARLPDRRHGWSRENGTYRALSFDGTQPAPVAIPGDLD